MIRNYLTLSRQYYRFFIFSVFGIVFSAPGQTFLISLAIPSICDSLLITPISFASIYSIATIGASVFLPIIGRCIDRWPIERTIVFNAVIFFCSILLFSLTMNHWSLFLSLFFMRLFGQGALTLLATSYTIKYFHKKRGTALSLTQLGYPLSEIFFPGILLTLIHFFGWRTAFGVLSLCILCIYLPLSLFGSRDLPKSKNQDIKTLDENSKPLSSALKDIFFPIYVSLSSIPPIMMTATLYFQMHIFKSQGWAIDMITIALFFYAAFKFLNTLLIGPFIDRFGLIFPLFFLNFCIGLATLCISITGPAYIGLMAYSLYGLGLGASAATMSYLWGRLYGTYYIGEIKGAIGIIRNGATAIAPLGFSIFIYQWELPFQVIFFYCGILIILMSMLPFILQFFDQRLSSP